jgi:hypothetical protein
MAGAITIDSQSAARFELTPGNDYDVVVFQAERQVYGSSLMLRLSGFVTPPNGCL